MIASNVVNTDDAYIVSLDLDELKRGTDNRFTVVRANLGAVNDTVAQLQEQAKKLSADLADLESRLGVIESQPQEKLIEQVDSIHREVSNTQRELCLN